MDVMAPPADSPITVTFPGSPPNDAMFSFTHSIALLLKGKNYFLSNRTTQALRSGIRSCPGAEHTQDVNPIYCIHKSCM